jgi:hypothetical protein
MTLARASIGKRVSSLSAMSASNSFTPLSPCAATPIFSAATADGRKDYGPFGLLAAAARGFPYDLSLGLVIGAGRPASERWRLILDGKVPLPDPVAIPRIAGRHLSIVSFVSEFVGLERFSGAPSARHWEI